MNCNTNANFSVPNKLSSCPFKLDFSQVLAHCALTLLIQKRWLFYEAILFGISWPSDRWVDRILGFVTRASLIETSHFVARHMHDTAWLITTDTTGCLPRAMTFENVHTTPHSPPQDMMTICFLFLPPLKDL